MKDILFRGKQAHGNGWVHGFYIEYPKEYAYIQDVNNNLTSVLPESVGQYIGIEDKNGKEIYEGDIVRRFICIDDHGRPLYEIGEVVYDEEMAEFVAL